jgi:SpoVK/Ycf46/Vps4 family AAA+-type ATPase
LFSRFHSFQTCKQTQLAKAVAGEAHAAFLSIGPSDILSKYVGESEEAVRSVFAEAVRLARNNNRGGGGNRCTVLFFDEIDALGQSRGVGTSNNNGNGTTGGGKAGPSIGKSNQSGGSGSGGSGDNSSRRILAELLIQLTKINTVHGTYDSSSLSIDSSEENCDEEEKDKYFEESRLDSREEEENMDANFFSSSDDTPAVICQDKMILEEEDKVRRQHKHNNDIENNNSIDNDNDNRTVRVIVVAATNRPEDCDPALIRRFAVQVQVGLPKAKDRKKMLKKSMEDINHTITKKQFSDLSLITDGWSGSDLQSLAREAAMAPVRECIRRAALMKRRRLFLLSHSSRGRKNKNKSSNDPCEEENSSESKSENESEGNKSNSSSNNNTNQCLKKSIARDNDDSFTRAQKRLLEEFRNLRPVNFRDYTKALAFWFGRMYNNLYDSPLAEFGWIEDSGGNHDTNDNVHTGGGSLNEHYDSSSDEDDEEEALSIEVTESNLDTERMVQHWDTVV